MADDPTGLAAALAQQMAGAEIPGGAAEQLELTELAQLPLLGDIKIDGRIVTGGRPKGSLNKATKELAAYVLSRHRHPVIGAAEVCDLPVKELARALACDLIDAAKYQQSCREFVAKYTLQAMPQAIQVDMGTVGMLMVINQNSPRPGEQADRSDFALDLVPIQQNQPLSANENGSPHGQSPHDKQ